MSDTPEIPENFLEDVSGCAAGELFALRVLGDSMLPEFAHGAIIVIDPSGLVRDGAYVIAYHNEEYIFRRYRQRDGRHFLEATAEGYETIEIPGIEALKGVVVQKAGRKRKDRVFYTPEGTPVPRDEVMKMKDMPIAEKVKLAKGEGTGS